MTMKKASKKKIAIISSIVIISLILVSVLTVLTPRTYSHELSSFSSYNEFYEFLKEQGINDQQYLYSFNTMPRMMEAADSSNNLVKTTSGSSDDLSFSETNIQVEGVDEPDSVKTDGTYVYILSEQTIYIVQATPASSAQIVSTISLSNDVWYQSFFVNNDRLIVFGESSPNYWYYSWEPIIEENSDLDNPVDSDNPVENSINNTLPEPGYWDVPQVVIHVYDLSTITDPLLLTTIELDGMFVNARMIDSKVYVVASEHTYYLYRFIDDVDYFKAPSITVNNITDDIQVDQIYYVDEPDNVDSLTHILSLDISSLDFTQKSFLIGNTQDIYMSMNHIYLVYTSYEYSFFLFDSPRVNRDQQITRIHKIKVENDEITHIGSGEVPGRLVNQFSMDEHNTYFRIATTTGFIWDEENPSQNNVFILDDQLSIVSSIRDIATGEEIYSARFMGDKAFLVTFKNVDPFFTLDLSDPYDPQVLGELKIPGYSDYLHPYDEHHIIGIGKDAIASNDPNFAWYQGVKLALFNVSDFNNPTLVDTA
ncbi:MAG: beta-propeller domain-containing protein, partial [Candidatus Thermoplasmatota archaeon]|nr:beta-propeller domain-containing protein [Candidatus Thermoplasmatota archaeon]